MFEVTVLQTLAECTALRSQWIELVQSMAYPSPFVHPDWVFTALQVNKSKWIPYIVQVKCKTTLVALLPLYINKDDSFKVLHYIGDYYCPDHLGLCCNRENRRKYIDVIKKHFFQRKNWDVLSLNWLLQEEAMEWIYNDTSTLHEKTIAPYLLLPESIDVYLQSFKRKKRYNINASVRKFERAGGRYCAANDYQQEMEFFKNLFSIHARRSKERHIISSFAGVEVFRFHESLLKRMNNVWLRSLEIKGQVIAVLYGFLYRDRFFYYQIAHEPLYCKLSPGSVFLYKVIEECCNLGVKEFNFLQGNERYKWHWTKSSRTLYTVSFYNRTLAGIYLKQKEKAWSAAKGVVATLKK